MKSAQAPRPAAGNRAGPRHRSFPPAAREDAEILVLGSLPGAESLRRQQYYAHPRNGFWPILGRLLGFPPELPYPERIARLIEHRIALWDVVREGRRPGSLDSDIRDETVNDFPEFLRRHPHIRRLCFNGATAERLFKSRALAALPPDRTLELVRLPSTSPAHASLRLEEKLEAWRQGLCRGDD